LGFLWCNLKQAPRSPRRTRSRAENAAAATFSEGEAWPCCPAVLDCRNEGPARSAIVAFVGRVTRQGSREFVPPEDRVAVFDNDGTTWCEKPLPVQADFLLRRMGEMVKANPGLRAHQSWTAVAEGDHEWFGNVLTKH